MRNGRRNRWTLWACVGVVAGMGMLSFAAVPLYNLFCRVTGYGGTTQVAAEASDVVIDRTFRIRFDASTHTGLPWRFQPVRRELSVKVGETAVAHYRAENIGKTVNTGTATFNVTPMKAAKYFTKIECFCFTEQKLEPGEVADMPVTFYVDPEIVNNPNLDEVTTITLSYTFFRADNAEAEAKAALCRPGPDPERQLTDRGVDPDNAETEVSEKHERRTRT